MKKRVTARFHLRISIKGFVGYAKLQENVTRGFEFKITWKRKDNENVLHRAVDDVDLKDTKTILGSVYRIMNQTYQKMQKGVKKFCNKTSKKLKWSTALSNQFGD